MRKFEALINKTGLDDGGVASFTFKVDVLIKGKIYEEHQRWVDNNDGHGGLKQVPSGYVIDDNSCWNKIDDADFKNRFKEIF